MIDVLGPWIGLIGGSLAILWVAFSLFERFVINRLQLEVKIKRDGTGIENHEHPLISGWGFHNLRVRCKIRNKGKHPVAISRIVLRGKGGEIISTNCYEAGPTLPLGREVKTLTLHAGESRGLVLNRERARSIVKAASIPVVLEVYDTKKELLHRCPFVLMVETYPDENIPAPKDIAEEG